MDISSTLILPTDTSSSPITHSISYDLSNNIWSRWRTTPNPFLHIISNHPNNSIINNINNINNVPNISTGYTDDISNSSVPPFYNRNTFPLRHPTPLTSSRESQLLSYVFRRDPMEESFNDENKYKHIIADEEADNLKTIQYHAEDYMDRGICPISREKFEEGEEVILLPCSHLFKKEEILHWLKKFDATCPVCRHTFTSKEVKKEIPETQRPAASFRSLLLGLVDDQLRREDDAMLQRALLESLRVS